MPLGPALVLPRLVFGEGALERLRAELELLGLRHPLLVSDPGLAAAGVVGQVEAAARFAATFVEVPENPTAAGADATAKAYREASCDGIVALGGGSVLDTAKLVSALVKLDGDAAALIGKPERIVEVASLIAIPTTIGTGSDSSPVAALHFDAGGPPIGTRSPLLVPNTAICDPLLARSLPRRLIAATGIDALSHCIEGYFAEPANPIIDALALDGARRVFTDIRRALEPDGNEARASLMAAAFAGGAAIHKGLGPAHAVALACGDQHVHHGTLVGIALPHTTSLLARELPAKAKALAAAIGLEPGADLADALAQLIASLELPTSLAPTGYKTSSAETVLAGMIASPFNRTSPYVPSDEEYRSISERIGLA